MRPIKSCFKALSKYRKNICAERLQYELLAIEKWAADRCVILNACKNEEMIISKKRNQNHPPIHFRNCPLKPTNTSILGVTITNTLTSALYMTSLTKEKLQREFTSYAIQETFYYSRQELQNILSIHTSLNEVRTCLIWGGAGKVIQHLVCCLLDRLQKKALHPLRIDDPMKVGISPLEHKKKCCFSLRLLLPFFY